VSSVTKTCIVQCCAGILFIRIYITNERYFHKTHLDVRQRYIHVRRNIRGDFHPNPSRPNRHNIHRPFPSPWLKSFQTRFKLLQILHQRQEGTKWKRSLSELLPLFEKQHRFKTERIEKQTNSCFDNTCLARKAPKRLWCFTKTHTSGLHQGGGEAFNNSVKAQSNYIQRSNCCTHFFVPMLGKLLDACIWLDDDYI
jgi:hypothetical protein